MLSSPVSHPLVSSFCKGYKIIGINFIKTWHPFILPRHPIGARILTLFI